jgi:hypothetical protein
MKVVKFDFPMDQTMFRNIAQIKLKPLLSGGWINIFNAANEEEMLKAFKKIFLTKIFYGLLVIRLFSELETVIVYSFEEGQEIETVAKLQAPKRIRTFF